MKKGLILVLFLSALLLTGCNSREDVSHTSQKNMIKLVDEAIDEPITFIKQEGIEEDDEINYYFNLDDRDIIFKVTSLIYCPSIDGSQFGNYKEHITIYYEEAIMFDQKYIDYRALIASKIGLDDNYIFEYTSSYETNIYSYDDLKKVAEFIVALDKIYGFKESDSKYHAHRGFGTLKRYYIPTEISSYTTEDGYDVLYINTMKFTTSDDSRYKTRKVLKKLKLNYKDASNDFYITDEEIPESIYK